MTPARLIEFRTTFGDIQRAKNEPNGKLTRKSPAVPPSPDLTIDSSFLVFAHLPPLTEVLICIYAYIGFCRTLPSQLLSKSDSTQEVHNH